jgi:hypothetical protein
VALDPASLAPLSLLVPEAAFEEDHEIAELLPGGVVALISEDSVSLYRWTD